MSIVFFIIGLVLLITGAELFLNSVDKFGIAWRISPLIMGLTVVAFATGAPELAISLQAAADGQPDLVLGNIIGSNISNILLILGITGVLAPLAITNKVIKRDIPMVLAASVLMYVLAMDGWLTPLDGFIILAALVAYSMFIYFQIKSDRKKNTGEDLSNAAQEILKGSPTWFYTKYLFLLLGGLVMIVAGSRLMVDAAVTIAEVLGVSELIIGLTIVSIGTSLPEVATSLSAARKGDSDTAIANVLGSNLYNILLTLGLTIVIAPGALSVSAEAIRFDMPVMIIVVVACLPLFWPGKELGRAEATGFLLYYASYLGYLVLLAMGHAVVDTFELVMIWGIIPLTILLIIVKFVMDLRDKKMARKE
ncbi:calcium/sodium antiporter [Gracilimonas mengyeensis]|uniref:Cation:H+ antiporter n=1 Tax=Gracilimonas mengyeensis TaxID=1302730 RepID=A0A521C341_9BACT|nr:calcium/sodium antiporter [Gracilimonas mengyeensis]SMO53814.1 cation:H+ antiporter [Gracilimonas mengyeensis]